MTRLGLPPPLPETQSCFLKHCLSFLQHPEDQADRVTERFLTYQEHIEDIADYYERLAQHINADQDPHTVFENIESMIVKPLPRKE